MFAKKKSSQGGGNRGGVLSHKEIEELCRDGILISEGFNPQQLKDGCCYEFRVGSKAYFYDYKREEAKGKIIDENENFIVRPFETITIVTEEQLNLDNKHFLVLFSKASYYSLGLTGVATTGDPGYDKHLGITMTNLSYRSIKFDLGEGFVKGAFFRLNEPADDDHLYSGDRDPMIKWEYPVDKLVPEEKKVWRMKFLPLPEQIKYIRNNIRLTRVLLLVFGGITFVLGPLYGFFSNTTWFPTVQAVVFSIGFISAIIGILNFFGVRIKKDRNR